MIIYTLVEISSTYISYHCSLSHLLQPVTPKFARLSSRPKPPSHEEQEDAAFKEMQGTGFKAKPLDKRIFQSMGELGTWILYLVR